MTIKVSAICSSAAIREALDAASPTLAGLVLTTHTGSVQTLAGVLRRDQPDVLLLDCPLADEQAMEQIELALLNTPATHLVLVGPDGSPELLKRAMRAGVREVVPSPLSPTTVQQVVQGAQGHQPIHGRQQNVAGKVLAVIPAKGGAGGTFLTTNLAYVLSSLGKRVAVLDLNLYFGDAAIFLGNKKIVSSLVDLARQTQRLDSALLDSSMMKIRERLHLLAAAESPDDANEVSVAGVERIIELARSDYDFVLLDLGSNLDPITVRALDQADTIYLVLQLNLPFVRAAKHMAAAFAELGYSVKASSVIVNRYEKGGTIGLEDVEKATGLKIARTVPNSHVEVTESINQGIPLLEMSPHDPVAQTLRDWAQELAPSVARLEKKWWHGLVKS